MTNFRPSIGAAVVTLFCVQSQVVLAGSDSYCTSFAELSRGVKNCSENVYFAKAAQICLGKLEKKIESEKNFLNAAMLMQNATTASGQAARMENNSSNLIALRTTMATLESSAQKVRQEVVHYSENFVYAGPISKEMAEKFGLVKYLTGSFKCYTDNQAAIAQVVGIVDTRIAEFEKVSKAAREMETIGAANVQRQDTSSVNNVAHGRDPASGTRPTMHKRGSSANAPSSITGTEKIGESDRAMREAAPKK